MPLPFTIGTGQTLMWRRRTSVAPSLYVLHDDFTTAANPIVDGAAEPGPGTRDATGSLWKILAGRLRGGMQPTSPTWGSSKIVWDGQTRTDGLTMWAIVNPANKDATFGMGWASSAAVTDPTTNGHHWLMDQGYGRVAQPGKRVTLSELNADETGMFRATEYLVGVTLRAQGAFYWMSAIAPTPTGPFPFTTDRVGIPAYPSARVLWVDDTTTTTPMYPHVGALTLIGHVDGHVIDDLRVNVITDWATDAGMATFLDRFTRADSTTSVGTGWTNVAGTGGISSNQAYIPTAAGTRTFIERTGADGRSADGIWRWKVTVGSNTADILECHYRYVDTSNYMRVQFFSGSVWIVNTTGGAEANQASTPFSLSAGQVIDVLVVTKGNQSRAYINGDYKVGLDDTGGSNQTGTRMGYGGWSLSGTTARWDDLMWVPNTITLPSGIQQGVVPALRTAGSTIMADTFTGTNGAAINGRTPDTTGAGTWTTVGTGWEINTNRARNTNVAGSSSYFAWYNAGTPDVEITIDYLTPTGAASGVLLRYTDTSNYVTARVLGANGAANEIEIVEALGAPGVIVKHQYLGNFHLTGTTYTMLCQLIGDVLHVLVNGMPIISYIVHVPSSNKHGLYHSDIDATILFDQITIKALS